MDGREEVETETDEASEEGDQVGDGVGEAVTDLCTVMVVSMTTTSMVMADDIVGYTWVWVYTLQERRRQKIKGLYQRIASSFF